MQIEKNLLQKFILSSLFGLAVFSFCSIKTNTVLAADPVDGLCGLAVDGMFDTQPQSDLCVHGNYDFVISSNTEPWHWICDGSGGGRAVNCYATKQGWCNNFNAHFLANATPPSDWSTNGAYCFGGYADQMPAFPNRGETVNWTCLGSDVAGDVACSSSRDVASDIGVCGANNAATYPVNVTSSSGRTLIGFISSSTSFCASGDLIGEPTFPANGQTISWVCTGSDPSKNTTCSVSRQATSINDPACGTNITQANFVDGSHLSIPYSSSEPSTWSTGYCAKGSPSSEPSFPAAGVTASWTCSSSVQGADILCELQRFDAGHAACGPASRVATAYVPNDYELCALGHSPTPVLSDSTWHWTCDTTTDQWHPGTQVLCSAPKIEPSAINGACGSANETPVLTSPKFNLCAIGTPAPLNPPGSGPWNWTCKGENGGTTANCNAPIFGSNPTSTPAPTQASASSKEHGADYEKYKFYRKNYRNNNSKDTYIEVDAIRLKNPSLFAQWKAIFIAHKHDSKAELRGLDGKTSVIFWKYKNYNGYRNYKIYREKVYGQT